MLNGDDEVLNKTAAGEVAELSKYGAHRVHRTLIQSMGHRTLNTKGGAGAHKVHRTLVRSVGHIGSTEPSFEVWGTQGPQNPPTKCGAQNPQYTQGPQNPRTMCGAHWVHRTLIRSMGHTGSTEPLYEVWGIQGAQTPQYEVWGTQGLQNLDYLRIYSSVSLFATMALTLALVAPYQKSVSHKSINFALHHLNVNGPYILCIQE